MTIHTPSLVLQEIAARATLAAQYSQAAAALAAAGDGPGMAHALGCAGRAFLAASEAAALIRPKTEASR